MKNKSEIFMDVCSCVLVSLRRNWTRCYSPRCSYSCTSTNRYASWSKHIPLNCKWCIIRREELNCGTLGQHHVISEKS